MKTTMRNHTDLINEQLLQGRVDEHVRETLEIVSL